MRPSTITRLSEDQRRAIVDAIGAGATYLVATRCAGIPWQTWSDWTREVLDTGTHRDERIADLVLSARKARALSKTSALAQLRLAGKGDWRAVLAWLEFTERQESRGATARQRRAETRRTIAQAKALEKASTDGAGHVALILPDVLATPRGGTE
jgi:hypothetical protein